MRNKNDKKHTHACYVLINLVHGYYCIQNELIHINSKAIIISGVEITLFFPFYSSLINIFELKNYHDKGL